MEKEEEAQFASCTSVYFDTQEEMQQQQSSHAAQSPPSRWGQGQEGLLSSMSRERAIVQEDFPVEDLQELSESSIEMETEDDLSVNIEDNSAEWR